MKTFKTKHGTFTLDGHTLAMEGKPNKVEVQKPSTVNEQRIELIYNAVWNDKVENSPLSELDKIAKALEAILPEEF